MATTYEWTISELERNANDGGVVKIHYRLFASNETHSVNGYGQVSVVPNSSSPDFIPFEQLTKESVMSWVESALGSDEVDDMKQRLEVHLQKLAEPQPIQGKPDSWDLPEDSE